MCTHETDSDMAVGIVLFDNADAIAQIRWAGLLARSSNDDLAIFQLRRKAGTEKRSVVTAGNVPSEFQAAIDELTANGFRLIDHESESSDEPLVANDETELKIVQLDPANSVQLIQDEIDTHKIKLLVLPRNPQVRTSSPDFTLHRQLLNEVSCEIVQLSIGSTDGTKCRSILVPISEGAHSHAAVRHGIGIAAAAAANVSAIFIEPEVDEVAKQVGQQILERNLARALKRDEADVETKVVLASSVEKGIVSACNQDTDLIVLGKQHHGVVHRFLFRSISEALLQSNPGPAIAIFQPALPLANRIARSIDKIAKSNIPQLERDRRVGLVERIQSNSRWDFDFIALICLSALIAAGGLIQNSAAVVIGAMLVAPLMTPLLGTGLSLVQGNMVLFRNTIITVIRGFVLAYALGLLLGFLVPNLSLTSEILGRGSPGVLDLVVALISGIAAAYAIGRPNLLSALPGVAIAASLIPPVAASGISTAVGEFTVARGAALLFLTNIVAIILGTAASFWAVGIRGSHRHSHFNRWATSAGVVLILITIGLGLYESWPANRISPTLKGNVNQLLDDQDVRCDSIAWKKIRADEFGVQVQLSAPQPVAEHVIDAIIKEIRRDFETEPTIQILTNLQLTIRPDEP